MSPREVRSEEVKLEATEEAELSPAPESLSLGAMDTAPGNEVRVLSIDGVVERPGKQLEEDSGGLGARSKAGRNSSLWRKNHRCVDRKQSQGVRHKEWRVLEGLRQPAAMS